MEPEERTSILPIEVSEVQNYVRSQQFRFSLIYDNTPKLNIGRTILSMTKGIPVGRKNGLQ